MLSDLYDLPISTTSTAAQAAYNRGVAMLLGGEAGMARAFADAVDQDPGFALGHVGLARARMFSGDMTGARDAMATAQSCAGGITQRETSHTKMMALMIAGKAAEALAAVREHLAEHPRDALIAQTSSSIYGLIGFSGQPGREAETLAFLTQLLPHYGDDWWMMSQYAFALCETGQLARADTIIDRALALNPRNAHGAHVRSHVSYEAGEVDAGRSYLTDWLTTYSNEGVMHGHLNWHVALWALYAGDIDAMWKRVDDAVTPDKALAGPPLSTLVDTASILHRAELRGVTVAPERWAAISDFAARAFPSPGNAFVDVHAALAHAMAGNGAALRRIIDDPAGPAADLVPDLACGYRLLAEHDWGGAASHLTRAMADTARIGGSRAQRDLVEHSLLTALMRQGRRDEAQHVVALRRPVLAETVLA